MGNSCIGSRKTQPRRVQTYENTLSSQSNNPEPVPLSKANKYPSLTIVPYSFPISLRQHALPSNYSLHRQHRYQENLPFAQHTSKFEVQSSHSHKIEQNKRVSGLECSCLERQYWARNNAVVVVGGISYVLAEHLADAKAISNDKPSRLAVVELYTQIDNGARMRIQPVLGQAEIQQALQKHPKYQHAQNFNTPFLSGIVMAGNKPIINSKNDKNNNKITIHKIIDSNVSIIGFGIKQLATLLGLNQTPALPCRFILTTNPVASPSRHPLLPAFTLETYMQIACWIRQHHHSIWSTGLQLIKNITSASKLRAYLLLQMIKCIVDAHQRHHRTKDHPASTIRETTINTVVSLLKMEENTIKLVLFLYRIFLTLQNVDTQDIQAQCQLLLLSLAKQMSVVADGLLVQFGLQINQQEHPFRNHPCHFLQTIHQQNRNIRLLVKDVLLPDCRLFNHLQAFILRVSSDILSAQQALQLWNQQQALLQPYDLSTIANRLLLQEFQLRLTLLSYFAAACQSRSVPTSWSQLQHKINTYQYVTPQTLLLFYTLQALTTTSNKMKPDRTQQEQAQYLRALQLCHRIYGDPRTNRASIQSSSEQIWQVLVLQAFIDLYSNSSDKKQHYYLTNILECLKQDIKPWSGQLIAEETGLLIAEETGLLQRFLPHLPIRHWRGWWVLRGQQNQDTKSNYSQSVASYSSSRRTLHSSSKISEWQCSLKLQVHSGVIRWGHNMLSHPHILPPLKNQQVIAIASGNFHVIFATQNGIFGWGQNHAGQLGLGNIQKRYVKETVCVAAIMIDRKKDKIKLSCGNQHTAVLINGKLMMWGQKEGGILAGDGEMFDSVQCGGLHTLGVRAGQVYSWGRGEGGQLGHPLASLKRQTKQQTTQFYMDAPTLVDIPQPISKIACGDAHSLALSITGTVYVFGFSYQGQLGLGITGQSPAFQIFQPQPQSFFKQRIVDIWAGPTSSFFKTESEQVFSCGMNDCLQLGIDRVVKIFQKKKYLNRSVQLGPRAGEQQFSRPKKLDVFGADIRLNRLECGQNHCLALVDYAGRDKLVMGWGLNRHCQIDWQLGQNTTPRTLDSLFGLEISQLCCGATFSLANVGKITLTVRESKQLVRMLVRKSCTW